VKEERRMEMKLTELQSVLGEEINKVRQSDAGEDVIRGAQTVALLAKQVINNADIIIRFDKMKAAQPELSARIEELI
jgi:hypothetical protein